ncbi:hypothetical protein GOODEAATRI_007104 [Goodea atripinnis]|uniref:Secreted protein n=1 Tax=Goodea atripinnis TaxID=208336 RepID=A0ABV0N8M1_9TELE
MVFVIPVILLNIAASYTEDCLVPSSRLQLICHPITIIPFVTPDDPLHASNNLIHLTQRAKLKGITSMLETWVQTRACTHRGERAQTNTNTPTTNKVLTVSATSGVPPGQKKQHYNERIRELLRNSECC